MNIQSNQRIDAHERPVRRDGCPPGTHKPVMLNEVMELLNPCPGKVIADCTVGGGGHTWEILKRIIPGGFLIGIDKDGEVLANTRGSLLVGLQFKEESSNSVKPSDIEITEKDFSFYHADFVNLGEALKRVGKGGVDGILLDLGVSSIQLESAERGFSFNKEGPLDMRMDRSGNITAYDLINNVSLKDMESIIRRFGEERWSKKIARAIIQERGRTGCIKTTSQLAKIIESAVRPTRRKIHPATLTFQAIRIAVNKELENLEDFLNHVHLFLNKGGRIVVISFHSLEDRLVKNIFRLRAKEGIFRIITPKPLRPLEVEVRQNPRARSAKLRVSERI